MFRTMFFPKLTENERLIINRLMIKKGLSQGKLAKSAGIDPGNVSKILGGKIGLSGIAAQKLYAGLEKDKEIEFLVDYVAGKGQPISSSRDVDIKLSWCNLYDDQTYLLKQIFADLPTQVKAQILGDLEKLVDRYKPKSSSS